MLGEAFGTIQFPGGHLEENETLNDGLKREMLEENYPRAIGYSKWFNE